MVDLILRKGAEEARNQLPDLLDAAKQGRSTIITRHGRPVAALVPIEAYGAVIRQQLAILHDIVAEAFENTASSRRLPRMMGDVCVITNHFPGLMAGAGSVLMRPSGI
jgi:prevent-host-death family protein